jgi:hypothetical protein
LNGREDDMVKRRSVVMGVLAACLAGPAMAGDEVAGPHIAVEPASFDFGAVPLGKELEKNFVVRNVGSADLVIEQVVPTCGCTVVNKDYEKTLKPGARTIVRLKLKTMSAGRVEKSVLIRSNDVSGRPFELKLTADVAAEPAAPGR